MLWDTKYFKIVVLNISKGDDVMKSTLPFDFVSMESLGLNNDKVNLLVDYCLKEESDELLLISNNKVYHKNYTNNDKPIALNSLTKVFAGTAIGLLLDEGLLDSIHTPISTFFPKLKNTPKEEITVWHILTHTSGIKTVGHDNELSFAPDIVEYVLDLDLEDVPGIVSKYNNEAVAIISGIVKNVTGKTMDEYLSENLFHPLEITKWEWIKDKTQNPIAYAGLSLTGIDLAKFAYLFLNNGIWDSKRIISEDWIATSTHPTQDIDKNWGYLWLTAFKNDKYLGFGMSGFDGKYLFVSPDKNYIAIRLVHRKSDKPTPNADDFFKYAIDIIND